jgi:hypothetical protein
MERAVEQKSTSGRSNRGELGYTAANARVVRRPVIRWNLHAREHDARRILGGAVIREEIGAACPRAGHATRRYAKLEARRSPALSPQAAAAGEPPADVSPMLAFTTS